jgi:hypothetical protein
MVKGDHIIFEGQIPIQHTSPPNSLPLSLSAKIEEALNILRTKNVISQCTPEPREFVSHIHAKQKGWKYTSNFKLEEPK